MYLEDVELGLRLRLAGWTCRWEPRAVARHAGGGSSAAAARAALIERNTLLLVARYFRARWLPLVAYRQLAWAWHAARAGRLRGAPRRARGWRCRCCGVFVRERREWAVPWTRWSRARPVRGPRAGGPPVAARLAAGDDDALVPQGQGERPLRQPQPLGRLSPRPAPGVDRSPSPASQ